MNTAANLDQLPEPEEQEGSTDVQEEDSMRSDFLSAIDKLESADISTESVENDVEVRQAEDPERQDVVEDSVEVDKDSVEDSVEVDKAASTSTSHAPVGWKDKAAEQWKDVPREAQEHILNREREVNVLLQQTAQARKVAKDFSDSMNQYRPVLEQMGFRDPISAVNGVMQTMLQMRTGSTQERASAAARVIKEFGIDIGALDEALVADPGSSYQPDTSRFEQLLDSRLAPVNQLMTQLEQYQYQQQQEAQIATQTEVQRFISENEFGSMVRNDMADLLDMAAARGQQMSLKEAYDKACIMNPEISRKLEQQRQAQRQKEAMETRQRKQHAASSVRGVQGGVAAGKPAETISDALNEAWDSLFSGQ